MRGLSIVGVATGLLTCAEIASAIDCKGNTLVPGETLKPNEYLCGPNGSSDRFGLNFMGMPQMYLNDELVWHARTRGTSLKIQDDSHLVLYGEGVAKWETGCFGKTGGKHVVFDQGEVKVLDINDSLVWSLSPDGTVSDCYPGYIEEEETSAVTSQNEDCKGSTLLAGEKLLPNEYLCDPEDKSKRFGLNFMGIPRLYNADDELVWHAETRGEYLQLQEDDAHLVLYGEGVVKWDTSCFGKARGKSVVFDQGEVKVYDVNDNLVWSLSSDGAISDCYPEDVCKGSTLLAGEKLLPNEYLCDPEDKSKRFGLNFMGIPRLYDGDELVWFAEDRGEYLQLQEDDAHLVLYGEGAVKWETSCFGDVKGKSVVIDKGEVTVFDEDGSVVWILFRDGTISGCYPFNTYPNTNQNQNCMGSTLEPGQSLNPNEYLCDPTDSSTRFGMSFMGMPRLYIKGKLVWHADARGSSLNFQGKDAHLVLYGEGMAKWGTECYGRAKGRNVVFEQGTVEVIDVNDSLVWSLSPDGIISDCYPNIKADTTLPSITNPLLNPVYRLGECIGKTLQPGQSLKPNQFLCNPKNKDERFGLNFIGMPQLWHNQKLVWYAPARGTSLKFQKTDSHMVLYGEGMAKWSSKCFGVGLGKMAKFTRGGLVVVDEDLNFVWRVKANGDETSCYSK